MSAHDDTAFLKSVDLFDGLDDATLARLQSRLRTVRLASGEVLFNAGDPGNDLYIVRSGALAVLTQRAGGGRQRKVATITAGQCVGEMGLFMSGTRQATVRAESEAELCRLDRAAFQALLEEAPRLKSVFGRIIESRLPKLRAVLMDLFGGLDDNVFRDIESSLTWRRLLRGEVLFREGDPGDALYLIVHGRVQVHLRSGGGDDQVLGELGRGEWVGEMALLDQQPRSATVTALRDSDLLGLTRAGFSTVLDRNPKLLLPVTRSMSRRLRSANLRTYRSAIPPTSLSVAIVPLTPLPPLFVETLTERLSRDGKVIALSSAMFDNVHGPGASRIGPSDPRSPHLSSWLAQLEEDHRYVLYTADGEPSEWTDRCLRHADRIVFSMAFDAETAPEQIRRWRALAQVQARREIVFWHPPNRTTLPQHTAAVLRELPVERHHHLRLGDIDDIARLGRFLTNRPIGLVLSGGGARGFAHIGAYQALCEAGIPIDRVIGTSMGGFIGALIACRYDIPDIARLVRRVLVDRGGFGYTLPLLSLLQVRRSESHLRAVFEGRDIEDTWLPFSCCATNLTSSRLMVLNEGPLWRACRATTAVPGLCPPVFHQGDVLVDGAVLDNVPVDVASELEPGPLITCDVTKARALTVDPALDTVPPLRRLLWDRLLRRGTAESLPNIGTILTRSLDCTSRFRQESNRRMATLYFEPPVGDYGLLDMDRIDKFIDIGYHHVAEQLRQTDLNCVFDYRHEPQGVTSP